MPDMPALVNETEVHGEPGSGRVGETGKASRQEHQDSKGTIQFRAASRMGTDGTSCCADKFRRVLFDQQKAS